MLSTISSILSLLISFAILILSHGLQNNLLNVRGLLAGFDSFEIGLMGSAYFAGFIVGTRLANKYILDVGQIRTFAACVSLISAISLLHVIFIDPYFWIFLKFIYGLCISGAYMVIESWLNVLSNAKNRGRILSVYMVINFLGLFLGQTFINEGNVQSFVLFAVASILASISLVPLILSKAKQPEEIYAEPISIKKLYKISPLSVIGTSINGMAASSVWALGILYFIKAGFSVQDSALFIAFTFIGALLLQFPVGLISDIFNRRVAIILCAIISIVSCGLIIQLTNNLETHFNSLLLFVALIFGGFSYPLYSLLIALANDFLKPGMFVKASATLLVLNSSASIIGPIIAASFMMIFGNVGLFIYLIVLYSALLTVAYYRLTHGRKIPEETTESFRALPKTSVSLYNLDPRYEDKNEGK